VPNYADCYGVFVVRQTATFYQ